MLSPASYNKKTGLALLCPITSQSKGHPLEVAVPPDQQAVGVVLADQVRNLEWQARKGTPLSRVPPSIVREVVAKLSTLLSG